MLELIKLYKFPKFEGIRKHPSPLGFVKCFYGFAHGQIYPYYSITDYDKKCTIGFWDESSLDVPLKDCVFDFSEKESLEKRYKETGIIWGRRGK